MHISKHNFKELEDLICTLDGICFCQTVLCDVDADKLQKHFHVFLQSTNCNIDCIQGLVDDLKDLCNKITADD